MRKTAFLLLFFIALFFQMGSGQNVTYSLSVENEGSQLCVNITPTSATDKDGTALPVSNGSFCGGNIVLYTSLEAPVITSDAITNGAVGTWTIAVEAEAFGVRLYQFSEQQPCPNITYQMGVSQSLLCLNISECSPGATYHLLDQSGSGASDGGSGVDGQIFAAGVRHSASVDYGGDCVSSQGNAFDGVSNALEYVCSLLPVELLDFRAEPTEAGPVKLTWQTATELNNDYFAVERSADAQVFEELFRVEGAGTTTELQNYEVLDEVPLSGNNYYRLRQVDTDGTIEYSDIRLVNLDAGALTSVQVYPNPTSASLTISTVQSFAENGFINLLDSAGRIVLSQLPSDSAGAQLLDVRTLTRGLYFLQVPLASGWYTEEIILQ